MKYIHILLVIFLTGFYSFAQEVEFLPNDWENPAVFEKGQTLPHAFYIPYSSSDEALKNRSDRNENYQLLNGIWKFKWVETPDQVPENFWEPKFETEDWDEIKVPSNWQMEGFGHPKFRNIALTFESNPPNIPDYYNPVGCYKRKFEVTKEWKDKEVFLRFEGVKSASYVWVNGKRVGYNQGGFEPAEYNITPFLIKGENDLAMEVLRYSDGSYLENQDMWRLSGIFRDVKLIAFPKTYIRDYYVVTDLDRDYKDVTFKIETDIYNAGKDTVNCIFEFDVFDDENESILLNGAQNSMVKIDPSTEQKITLSTQIIDPPKWSAEYPNLYTLLVQLKDGEGNILEAFTKKIGFREVEYKNQILTVNGVPVKLNGVNSHMHDPEHGQAVPLETLRKDLLLMKQFNINCVRTSHYPPTSEYIEMANELGIYIIDEVGDETHANEWLSERNEWTEMYRDRSRKLVYRDRNEPSVIVWSAGNESGSGSNINEVIKTGKTIDPSRPAWMYGGNTFYIPFEDIVGPRYWLPIDYKNLAEGKVLPENDNRASFMDEYLAATGNGLGGMDEYWEYIWKYPRLTGGAIWDWVSPAIKTPRWILEDKSQAQNDGQIMGRPTFIEGKNGRGLEFSGHDDWIEFYRDSTLDITGNQISIGFWVKPYQIPQPNTFVAKGKYQYGIIMENPETLEFYIHSGKRISAKAKVSGDFYENWHYIAGIYNGSTLELYIDNQRVAQTRFNGNISNTPYPLCIGRDADTHDQGEHSGRLSKMVIDDMRIFDKAVSLTELQNNFNDAVLSLDFESDTIAGDFYAVGLSGRTYGIIWPDREIQPEIYQIKKSGQPIKIEAIDIENGVMRITNRHHFKNLNEYQGIWVITVDGDTIQRGFFEPELEAGKSMLDTISYRMPQIDERSECILTISFILKSATSWADEGFEVAWEQFMVPTPKLPKQQSDYNTKLSVADNKNEIRISGSDFVYVFSKETGALKSIQKSGTEYLDGEPEFKVWRPPLANDSDPWGSQQFTDRNFTPGFGRSIDNQLRTLGLKDLETQLYEIEVRQLQSKVVILTKVFSNSSLPANRKMNSWANASAFEQNNVWTIFPDGTIELDQEIIPHGTMPDMLQKVGLQFHLQKAFNAVEWYGRGPFENYPDRKTGAKTGLYKSDANEMYVPYVIPQEYGNRSDTRWIKVLNNAGRGLYIRGEDLFNFSLHKYSDENLERAYYTYQLKESSSTILNIDYEVTGVGDTANRQLQKYRVLPEVKRYSLTIKPF